MPLPLTVRPVVHTADVPAWLAVLRALGGVVLTDDPLWTEVSLDSGRVTLTELNRGATEGSVVLGFETDDLEAYAESVTDPGPVLETYRSADYTSVRVVARDGLELLVDEPPAHDEAPGGGHAVTVLVEWVSPDPDSAVADLRALGLVPIPGAGGLLRAEGGEVLVSPGDGAAHVDLAVVVLDVAAVRAALTEAGVEHDEVDGALLVRPTGPGSLLRVVRL